MDEKNCQVKARQDCGSVAPKSPPKGTTSRAIGKSRACYQTEMLRSAPMPAADEGGRTIMHNPPGFGGSAGAQG